MVIDVSALSGLSVENVTEMLESSSVPAIVIDEGLKISYKTTTVSETSVGFKLGAPISRFVSERDLYNLSRLAPNESFCASFDTGYSRCGVVFIGCEDCKIAILSPFYAEMLESVDGEYRKMSGYDITLGGRMNAESPAEEALREQSISRILSETLSGLNDIHGLPFFNATAVLRLLTEATGSIRGISRDLFELDGCSDETYICGSQRNFALVLASAVSFYASRLSGGKVNIGISATESEATVSVSAILNDSSYKTRIEPRLFENGKPFDVSVRDESFWLYLAKLLADANLWDINFEAKNGRAVFSVSAPLLIAGNELVVRDSVDAEITAIFETMLALFSK